MLKKLRLKNFKLHEDTTFDLGRITVFIGPQGAGKSSVLQALRLLKNSSGKEGLNFSGPSKGLEFVDIVHQRKERSVVTLGLELSCAGAPAFLSETGEFDVAYEISFDNRGFRQHHSVYTIGKTSWEFRIPRRPGRWTVPEEYTLKERPSVKFIPSSFTLYPFRFSVEGQDYSLHRGMTDLRLAISDFFKLSQFVPETRLIDRNTYTLLGTLESLPQTIEEVISKIAVEWDTRDEVSDHLHQVLGRRINCRAAGEEVEVEVADGLGAPYPVMCEGGGLRSVVWPLAAMATAEPGSLVAIEEPEIHLHPGALAKFCDVLVERAGKDVQLVMTTHNEHLLLSLLLQVGKGRLKPDELAVYYLEEKSGRATARRLEVDEKGSLAGGLTGFFEVSLEEFEGFISTLTKTERNQG